MTKVKSCLLCENYKTHPCECVHCEDWDNFRTSEDGKNLVKRIENEVRPKGEWIDEHKDYLICKNCGKMVYKPFIGGFPTERTQHYSPNFCAFCGADMRGEDK